MSAFVPPEKQIRTLDDHLFQVPVRHVPLSTLGITVYLAEITPKVAEVMLLKKNTNRSLKLSQLNRIKRALEHTRWEVNGETIIFDHAGQLIEGQHRLKAVVETGLPIWSLIVHGIDRERFKTMGQGSKRTAGDILGIQGVKNSRNIAAALRWVYRYEHDLMSNPHPNITDDELADKIVDHPAIVESLAFGAKAQGLAAPGMITALHYLCHKRDAAMANHFFWTFATGEHLAAGDVLLVLRNRFVKFLEEEGKRTKKRTRLILRDELKAPMIVLAWNILRKEGASTKLKDSRRIAWHFREGQKFPKIL